MPDPGNIEVLKAEYNLRKSIVSVNMMKEDIFKCALEINGEK